MTPPGEDIGREDLEKVHRKAGFTQCVYHYVIRRNGMVEVGRPEARRSPADDGPEPTIALCLIGGADKDGGPRDNYTDDQKTQLVVFLHHNAKGKRVLSKTPTVKQKLLDDLFNRTPN